MFSLIIKIINIRNINNSVIELSNTIDSKANKYDVSLKANKSDVDVLTKKLNY